MSRALPKLLFSLLMLLTAAVYFMPAHAQVIHDSTTGKLLDELIKKGKYKAQSIKNSVNQVRVVNQQRIQLSGATNVQQVLNNQLGFLGVNIIPSATKVVTRKLYLLAGKKMAGAFPQAERTMTSTALVAINGAVKNMGPKEQWLGKCKSRLLQRMGRHLLQA